MLKLILITIIIVGIAVAGFAIKMFVKKDGEFKKAVVRSILLPEKRWNAHAMAPKNKSVRIRRNKRVEHLPN